MVRSSTSHRSTARRNRRVVIEGVPRLSFRSASNSFIKALSVALQFRGESWTYDQLMGLSGAAFRLQISRNGWCPSSPHACCGYPCAQAVQAAIGYELTPIRFRADDPASLLDARREIVRRISAGELVLYGSEEEGLVVGYEAGGKVLLVRHPACKTDAYEPMKGWPWGFEAIDRTGNPLDGITQLRDALERAVELSHDGLYEGYELGLGVYDRWCAELEEDAYSECRSGKGSTGNAWIYENLVDARMAAAGFLRSSLDGVDAGPRRHLERAAECYEKMRLVLADNQCPVRIAPYPWSLTGDQRWTREMRLEQSRRLMKAKDLDRAAVEQIGEALQLLPA